MQSDAPAGGVLALVVRVVLGRLLRISTMVLARKTVKLKSSMTVETPCRQHLSTTPLQSPRTAGSQHSLQNCVRSSHKPFCCSTAAAAA